MPINWHCCRPNPSTKTLQAQVTNLSRRLLRASCNGRYFRSLNLLALTNLSQQRCGSATTAPFSYSDATTFKSSAGVYSSYTPKRRGITNTYIYIYCNLHCIYIYIYTTITTQCKFQCAPMSLCTAVSRLVGKENTTSASCRGSRPSWVLVGARCSNQMQVAQGQSFG